MVCQRPVRETPSVKLGFPVLPVTTAEKVKYLLKALYLAATQGDPVARNFLRDYEQRRLTTSEEL